MSTLQAPAPQRTRVQPRATPRVASPAPARQRRSSARPASRPSRAPFVLLVIALLGGGLVSLLLLNTILAQGSFTLHEVQKRNAALAQQEQALERDVALQDSPEVLAKKARALGMVPSGDPAFLDTRNGRVYGHPAPGRTPPRPRSQTRSEASGGAGDHAPHGTQAHGMQAHGAKAHGAKAHGASGRDTARQDGTGHGGQQRGHSAKHDRPGEAAGAGR